MYIQFKSPLIPALASTLAVAICFPLIAFPLTSQGKPQPPPRPRIGLTFPHQDVPLAEKSTLELHLNCPARWQSAEITTRVTAVTAIAKKSAATSITCPASLSAPSDSNRHTATVEIPFTVAKNGEYLIEFSVRYKAGDATAGKATNTAAILTENGKSWLGLGTIEYAFIERTKADLKIEGAPAGIPLAKLNALLKTWDEKRQATSRKN